jgi:hypothetical protein
VIEPPYPADTRARGWRFELDYERIEQSDTWSLAAEIPMAQHALLMMWLVAWGQSPCGTLPNDEAVIRAKCRIPATNWAKFREVLMRGWKLATDGRLYHDVMTQRVIEMMSRRRRESDRKAMQRAGTSAESHACPTNVPPVSHGTDMGLPRDSASVPRESGTDNRLPTEEKNPPTPRKRGEVFDPLSVKLPDWLPETVWREWVQSRGRKRLSEIAVARQLRDLGEWRAKGHDPVQIIGASIRNGWQGLFEPKGSPPAASDSMASTLPVMPSGASWK